MKHSPTKWNKNNGNHNAFKAYQYTSIVFVCVCVHLLKVIWAMRMRKKSALDKFIAKTQIECVAKWENNKINKQINGIDGNFGE